MTTDEPNLPGVEFVDAAVGIANSLQTRECDEIMTAAAINYSALGLIDDALKCADEISDSYTRDTTLAQVAVNVVAAAPDTDPLSVIETIDDPGNQNLALEEIAAKYAELNLFDDALEIRERLDDGDSALSRIVKIMGKEDSLERSQELASEISDDNTRIACLTELASIARERDRVDEAVNLLVAAAAETESVDSPRDRLYQLMSIGDVYEALNQREKAKEFFSRAFELVDQVEPEATFGKTFSRDELLVDVAGGFARSRLFDDADQVAEQIEYPFKMAQALIAQAVERFDDGQGERALQMLSEAHQLIISEDPREDLITRNLVLIELTYAYGKVKDFAKGLEAALLVNNLDVDPEVQSTTLTGLGSYAAIAGFVDSIFEIQNAMSGEFPRARYLVLISDNLLQRNNKEIAAKLLLRAIEDTDLVQRVDQRCGLLIRISFGLISSDLESKANELLSEVLNTSVKLEDSHQQAQILVALADQYRRHARPVRPDEKQLLEELPS